MGGPAFPAENARQTGPHDWRYEGMTVWDRYAEAALNGILSSDTGDDYTMELVTNWASEAADNMLRERAKRMQSGND